MVGIRRKHAIQHNYKEFIDAFFYRYIMKEIEREDGQVKAI